jgi:cell cycle sensor histidine kinase DivJ
VPADLPDMVADRRALNQIMINLISNALKFTRRGGCVVVSAGAERTCLVVSVEDNGVGVSAEDLPRLGDPFFQAGTSYDRRHDGTGLGLSIVRGLVALHEGTIEIRSRLGEGTCVTVRLPLDCERRSVAAIAARPIKVSSAAPSTADVQVKKSA